MIIVAALHLPNTAHAGIGSKTIREAAEFLMRRGGKEVAEETAETLAKKMAGFAARHGDDVVSAAFRRVGPRAGRLVEEAGEHGGVALKLLARHGDDALPLVGKAASLRAVARYGDDAAEAIIKHGAVGEKLVEQCAKDGAEALVKVTPQNGRRLAMMAVEGQLKPELLTVIRKYGDSACDFVWSNKGALATGAILATFVANPEPYLEGTQQLTATVAEAAVRPLAEVPKTVAAEAAANTNWTLLGVLVAAFLAVLGYGRLSLRRAACWPNERPSQPPSESTSKPKR